MKARSATSEPALRWYDEAAVEPGGELFAEHCTARHCERAQDAANWQELGADGRLPAPPLDGTGHGWHHPANALLAVTINGSPGAAGNMPAWRDTLTPKDMAAVIAWFQSLWPDPIYRAWLDIERRSRQ